ncbi:hypothetical protein ATANTOWER_032685 [Ataeniobius toweri]|uniref:Uncharacterized protein n=1 Tax=Ataeniobius toweri TaxID=208326 RepID=A0ABU7BVY9_9TELE|nr:hypothetical protein [Ataeniobius toweri]
MHIVKPGFQNWLVPEHTDAHKTAICQICSHGITAPSIPVQIGAVIPTLAFALPLSLQIEHASVANPSPL